MRWAQRCVNLWNNLGFSLYAVLSVCHMVAVIVRECGQTLGLGLVDKNRTVGNY